MAKTFRKRDFFLNKDLVIPSRNRYKRAMITGFLSMMCVLISVFYLVYHQLLSIENFNYYTCATLIAAGSTGFWLNRNGYHLPAKLIVLLTGTISVFLFSAQANFQTDTHFYYVLICLSAFSLFGHNSRWLAMAFVAVSLSLFYISFLTGYSPLPDYHYPPSYIRSTQVINFTIALMTSAVIVYYTVRLNHHSEEVLNKKQEEITAQNAALTKTNAELDSFVYSASHDLRAPLASVLGLIHIARRSHDAREIQLYLDMMSERVNRLDEFIHEIIDFARNSRTDVQRDEVYVQQMVNQVLESLRSTLASQPIDFYVDIPDDLCFHTDLTRLTVILNNLISNAIKYHDERKQQPFIRIAAVKGDAGYAITVKDNGIGIENEHQSRIFDMFYRASDRSKGSGLGLYIVKESVHKLQGSIILKSQPGEGSTFTVEIPGN
jgi:signal transduction histidine kinase